MFHEVATPLDTALSQGKLPALETFACPYDATAQSSVIRITFPEFTCLCPKTGYPDFATIHLLYLPAQTCIELKSWKLYLNAFRMIGTFHETVTAHLFNTITGLLQPQWAMVVGDFTPRGNVHTTIVFETKTPRPQGVDIVLSKNQQ